MVKHPPGFYIYPRGFIGAVPAAHIEKAPKSAAEIIHSGGQMKLNIYRADDHDLTANPEIEELYGTYIKRAGDTGSIAFKDKILEAALSAFGTRSFYAWVKQQHLSPSCGELHYRFLTETVAYLGGKKLREMSLQNWMFLISIEDSATATQRYHDVVADFFGLDSSNPNGAHIAKRNDDLIDVLQMWCSHPNGIEDLLQTLHLLFGNP
jgi:hypothetical protein